MIEANTLHQAQAQLDRAGVSGRRSTCGEAKSTSRARNPPDSSRRNYGNTKRQSDACSAMTASLTRGRYPNYPAALCCISIRISTLAIGNLSPKTSEPRPCPLANIPAPLSMSSRTIGRMPNGFCARLGSVNDTQVIDNMFGKPWP